MEREADAALTTVEAALNAHDARAVADAFTPDGWSVDVAGRRARGREDLLRAHELALAGPTERGAEGVAGTALRPDVTMIAGARVFDGERLLGEACVLIADGRIVAVDDRTHRRAGCTVVDGSGGTLLPGLIDVHVHVDDTARLVQALTFGVTTSVDLFNDPSVATRLRAEAATRDDVSDFRSAGTGATAARGHPTQTVPDLVAPFDTVGGPMEAATFVAARVAEGSDLLKIFVEPGTCLSTSMPALDEATVAALADAARAHGLLSLAHCVDAASARLAVLAGVDGLAHIYCDSIDPEFPSLARRHGIVVVPTLVMLETLCGVSRVDELICDLWVAPKLDDAALATLRARWPLAPAPERDYGAARATVGALHAAGVPILAGSDAINPGTAHGASLHRELELLVDAGLTNAEALRAATSATADHLHLSDRGRIATGQRADLVLVEGDPLSDIRATRRIRGVWRRGVGVPPFTAQP